MSWEVLTMRSAKSFFNPTIARSDLRYYWPMLFGYVGIWILLLPMQVWSYRSQSNVIVDSAGDQYQISGEMLMRICINNYPAVIIMALLFGVGMVMLVFSYLMNARSVGAMHALPIRRGGLFTTHFLTGFAMLTAGNLFITALTWLAALAVDMPLSPALLTWLAMVTVLELFFMALATLCAVLTGWLLAVPVLYAAANGGILALSLLGQAVANLLLRGYSYDSDISPFVRWLTPVYQMFYDICQTKSAWLYDVDNDETLSGLTSGGWQTLLWYGLAALVLLALSYFLYVRRKSELSGDPVAFRWMRPVFRLGIGLAGGLAMGLMLYYIIALYTGSEANVLGRLLVSMVLMGAICYFAAAMLVNKSLKVFRRGWKGAVLTAALLVLLCVGIRLDPLGYSRWLPAQDEIVEVQAQVGMAELSYDDEPAAIEAALNLHQAILSADDQEHDDMETRYFNVSYRLQDGRTVSRQYRFDINGAANDAMRDFVALPQVQRSFLISGQKEQGDKFLSGYIYLYNSEEGTQTLELTAQQAEALYQAALSDADNGRALQDISGYYGLELTIELYGEESYCAIYNLSDTCTDTLAALEALGIPTQLLLSGDPLPLLEINTAEKSSR